MIKFKRQESTYLRQKRARVNRHNFETIAQIGQGGYGRVYLARHTTGTVVALKQMRKRTLVKMNEVEHILSERDILTRTAESKWLVSMFYSFTDADWLYLAMVRA